MKNVTIVLLFACFSAMFTSCVKTDIKPDTTIPNPNISNNGSVKDGPVSVIDPNTGSSSAILAGDWILVSDSTYSTGVDASDHTTIGKYIGQGGDHFNFTADGKLYIKEGGAIDTATYTISANRNIEINYSYYAGMPVSTPGSMVANFAQMNITDHSVTLYSTVSTSDGTSSRVINLKR